MQELDFHLHIFIQQRRKFKLSKFKPLTIFLQRVGKQAEFVVSSESWVTHLYCCSPSLMIIVLLTGLLMAFSFQLVLTNLGVILGLLVPDLLGRGSQEPAETDSIDSAAETSSETSSNPPLNAISAIAGFGILLSVNLTLSPASFLAVKLGQIDQPELGAIQGLVLWAAYFLLLTWLSSLALNSLLQTLLETVTGGVRQLWSAIATGFRQVDSSATEVIPEQVEARVQAVLEEFDLEQQVQTYLNQVQPTAPSSDWLQEQLAPRLNHPVLQSKLGQGLLQRVDQQTVATWLQSHTDFSPSEAQHLTDQLTDLWEVLRDRSQQGNLVTQLIDALDTAPESSALEKASDRQNSSHTQATDANVTEVVGEIEVRPQSRYPLKAGLSSLVEQIDAKAVLRELLSRADLSDWKVMNLWQKFQQLVGSAEPLEIVPAEVEHYLLTMPTWNLTPAAIAEDFPELLYDPEAHPVEMQRQLQSLHREQIQQLLAQRAADLEADVDVLANQIESIRQQVLGKIEQSLQVQQQSEETSEQEAIAEIPAKLESYLKYTNIDKLTPDGIERKLQTLIEETDLSVERLRQQMPILDETVLTEVLSHRKGLSARKRDQVVAQLQKTWDTLLPDSSPVSSISQRFVTVFQDVLAANQVEQLDLEDLKPYILRSLNRSRLNWQEVAQEASTLDWSPLTAALAEYNLKPHQVEAILDWSQQRLYQMARLPRRWLSRSRRHSQQFSVQLQRYLQHQSKTAFTPERISSDLQQMVQPFMDSAETVGDSLNESISLAWPDRDQMTHLLAQRGDLATDEIEQISDRLASAWTQTQQQIQETYQQASSAVESLLSQLAESVQSVSLPDVDFDFSDVFQPIQTRLQQLAQTLPSSLPKGALSQLSHRLDAWQQNLRDRISGLSDEFSETVTQNIQDQITALQDQISQQIAQIEHQTLQRIHQIRRAAIAAAGWLFCIAVSSAVMSALAGFVAVQGFSGFSNWMSWLRQMGG